MVTHDLGWWLVEKPMVDFLFALIELFPLSTSITVPELWGEMCTPRLFSKGSTYLHSNFTWTASSPSNHCWHQKTRDTRLSGGEDRIPLHSLVLTQYLSVTDGQTDWRIYRSIYSACKASFAVRCKNDLFYIRRIHAGSVVHYILL